MTALLVAVGGASGSLMRYLLDGAITRITGSGLPWGTLVINVAGSAAIGVLLALAGPVRPPGPSPVQALLGIGLLGGFTTFSAFSAQTMLLAQAGEWARAAAYVVGSVALCLVGVWLGYTAVAATR